MPVADWYCCGDTRQTQFCPACGSKRPKPSSLDTYVALAVEFEHEGAAARKSAFTHLLRAETIRLSFKLEDDEPGHQGSTYCDRVNWHIANAEGQKIRASKAERRAVLIRELVDIARNYMEVRSDKPSEV